MAVWRPVQRSGLRASTSRQLPLPVALLHLGLLAATGSRHFLWPGQLAIRPCVSAPALAIAPVLSPAPALTRVPEHAPTPMPSLASQEQSVIAPINFSNAIEVTVEILPDLRISVLEASLDWQEQLIEEAVESWDQSDPVEADPYGAALWPAAQVLAQAVAAHVRFAVAADRPVRVLELGAGCGLSSLTAAALGASVMATDFRELPLRLVAESARRQGFQGALRTQLLDVRDGSKPLPQADLVVASDVVYEQSTARAVARRIAEARERGSTILVSDIGRPNRAAFLEELRHLRPTETAEFEGKGTAVQGTDAAGGPSAAPSATKGVRVELLELPRGIATKALQYGSPSVMIRPACHGHVL